MYAVQKGADYNWIKHASAYISQMQLFCNPMHTQLTEVGTGAGRRRLLMVASGSPTRHSSAAGR